VRLTGGHHSEDRNWEQLFVGKEVEEKDGETISTAWRQIRLSASKKEMKRNEGQPREKKKQDQGGVGEERI